jgi:hypothetical protein
MSQYTVDSGDVTFAGSALTLASVLASATRRAKIKQIIIACSDAPADATAVFALRKMTVDGTGTGGTAYPVDAGDGAPNCTTKHTYTIEPTYATGNIYAWPLNQRVTMIWNAPFGGEPASNLSGGTDIGWGLVMLSGPNLKYRATIQWEE